MMIYVGGVDKLMFTLIQMLTLDSWNVIVRRLGKDLGNEHAARRKRLTELRDSSFGLSAYGPIEGGSFGVFLTGEVSFLTGALSDLGS